MSSLTIFTSSFRQKYSQAPEGIIAALKNVLVDAFPYVDPQKWSLDFICDNKGFFLAATAALDELLLQSDACLSAHNRLHSQKDSFVIPTLKSLSEKFVNHVSSSSEFNDLATFVSAFAVVPPGLEKTSRLEAIISKCDEPLAELSMILFPQVKSALMNRIQTIVDNDNYLDVARFVLNGPQESAVSGNEGHSSKKRRRVDDDGDSTEVSPLSPAPVRKENDPMVVNDNSFDDLDDSSYADEDSFDSLDQSSSSGADEKQLNIDCVFALHSDDLSEEEQEFAGGQQEGEILAIFPSFKVWGPHIDRTRKFIVAVESGDHIRCLSVPECAMSQRNTCLDSIQKLPKPDKHGLLELNDSPGTVGQFREVMYSTVPGVPDFVYYKLVYADKLDSDAYDVIRSDRVHPFPTVAVTNASLNIGDEIVWQRHDKKEDAYVWTKGTVVNLRFNSGIVSVRSYAVDFNADTIKVGTYNFADESIFKLENKFYFPMMK